MGFGDLLNSMRMECRKSLRDVGREAGVSAIYLSDIERGNRRPPSLKIVAKIAKYLGDDEGVLLREALADRDAVELPLDPTKTVAQTETALMLARVWPDLDEERLASLTQFLQGLER